MRPESIYSSIPPSPSGCIDDNGGGSTTAGASHEDMAATKAALADIDDQILLHRLSVDPIPWDLRRPQTAPGPRATLAGYKAARKNMFFAAPAATAAAAAPGSCCGCSCGCASCQCGCNSGATVDPQETPCCVGESPSLPHVIRSDASPRPPSSTYCSCTGHVSSLASFSPSLRPSSSAHCSPLMLEARPADVDGNGQKKKKKQQESDALSFCTALSSVVPSPAIEKLRAEEAPPATLPKSMTPKPRPPRLWSAPGALSNRDSHVLPPEHMVGPAAMTLHGSPPLSAIAAIHAAGGIVHHLATTPRPPPGGRQSIPPPVPLIDRQSILPPPPLLPLQHPRHRRHSAIDRSTVYAKRASKEAATEADEENEEDVVAASLTASAPSLPTHGGKQPSAAGTGGPNLMQTLFASEQTESVSAACDDTMDLSAAIASSRQTKSPMTRDLAISPLSARSVPVVTQARRARHPVYKFGAYANDTFTSGRHQEAFELYSWALMLLNPPDGTTPTEMLSRSQGRKQLQRLGWNVDLAGKATAESSPAVSAMSPISPANNADQARRGGELHGKRSSTWHTKLSALGRSIGGSGGGGLRDADVAGKPSTQHLNTRTNEGENAAANGGGQSGSGRRRLWQSLTQSSRRRSFGKPPPPPPLAPLLDKVEESECAGSAIVIDEPLPEELTQTPSGRFEFSQTMLQQLLSQKQQQQQTGGSASTPSLPDDPWWMGEGDEKTDICALLYSNRAAAAHALGKYTAAVSDASKSIALRPDWPKAYFRKAEALLALARIREAYGFYKRAAVLEPNDIHVRVSCERARIMAQNEELGLTVVQMLAGRDFALKPKGLHPIRSRIFEFAAGMQNYIYLIADSETRKCVVLDACWDVDGILAIIEREKLLLAAAAVSHGHFDHMGGIPPAPFSSLRIKVSGIGELKRRMPHLPLLVHPLDIPDVIHANPHLKPHQFTPTPNGFSFKLGARTQIQFLHTPGHTPGSQCLLVNECRLFSGDTLFPGSCGRVDLKGGCKEDMIESLQTRLGSIPDQTIVYPGHEYGGEWTSIGREKKRGFLKPVGAEGSAEDKWRRLDQCRRAHKPAVSKGMAAAAAAE
ncbi:hypothetical protein GGI22_000575 [Coemansia erecta]|nr:hypothetical protein GGI22_000575 [Coemansia erecta]